MNEDLKKPQPDDVPGQLLLEVRCGRGFGRTYTLQLEEENAKLRKEIRDLKATLDESAANGGAWLV